MKTPSRKPPLTLLGFVLATALAMAATSTFMPKAFADEYCNNFCSQLVDRSNGKVLGLHLRKDWTPADDTECATLAKASGSPTSTVPASDLAMTKLQCEWHSSQVMEYCHAYFASNDANAFQKIIIPLDFVATGVCATACFTDLLDGGAGEHACDAAGIAAGSASGIATLMMKASATNKFIQATMGAAGALLAAVPHLVTTGDADISQVLHQKVACIATASFAAMAGMRIMDLVHADHSKNQSCQMVHSLASNVPILNGSAVANRGLTTMGSDGGDGSDTRSSGASIGSGTLKVASDLSCVQNGLGQNTCDIDPAHALAALDGGMLAQSGLDKIAAQNPLKYDLGNLAKQLSDGSGAGSALASMMGANFAADKNPAADLAKAAQEHAQDFKAAMASLEGAATYTAGGAAGAPKNQNNVFSFGNFEGDLQAQSSEVGFVAQRKPSSLDGSDIFHSSWKGSIFDIISTKLTETRDRITQAEYTSPLNRALLGLPAKSARKTE